MLVVAHINDPPLSHTIYTFHLTETLSDECFGILFMCIITFPACLLME